MTSRFWECDNSNEDSVAGKIRHFVPFWEHKLKASNFTLDIVKNGYKIPFLADPPSFYAANNKSSLQHPQFVEQSISKLLSDECISAVDYPPYCINPLTVTERNSKLRLVLDLRHVNTYIDPPKFKYENLKKVSELYEKNDYIITFDLKSGYHHVPINKEFRTFLGFSWKIGGVEKYFVFNVLPFGLNIACFVFTKLMRQLIKKWRSEGIKCAMYIDDGIAGDDSFDAVMKIRNKMLRDLLESGLTVNFDKSSLTPEREKIWLGFIVNTSTMNFEVPETKIEKLCDLIEASLSVNTLSARQLAKIAGQIVSMSIAIGPLSFLLTKQMHKLIECRQNWDRLMIIPHEVRSELDFWKNNLSNVRTFRIKTKPEITKVVYSDASGYGYGGFVVEKLGRKIARGGFDEFEIDTSSTFRELLAVKYVLQSFESILKSETVEWFSDNMNTCRIINSGSSKQHLQNLAIEIYNLCVINNTIIHPTWIPREENQIADAISKSVDTDDWSIDNETFSYIESNFGCCTIDRFADTSNSKTKRFNSKYFCPETNAVNAFSCDWGDNELNWLCPPISLIGKTIQHLKNCKGRGILFLPIWPSAYYWPLLTSNGKTFRAFIKQFLVLDPYFINNSRTSCVFDGFAKFYSIALYIDLKND